MSRFSAWWANPTPVTENAAVEEGVRHASNALRNLGLTPNDPTSLHILDFVRFDNLRMLKSPRENLDETSDRFLLYKDEAADRGEGLPRDIAYECRNEALATHQVLLLTTGRNRLPISGRLVTCMDPVIDRATFARSRAGIGDHRFKWGRTLPDALERACHFGDWRARLAEAFATNVPVSLGKALALAIVSARNSLIDVIEADARHEHTYSDVLWRARSNTNDDGAATLVTTLPRGAITGPIFNRKGLAEACERSWLTVLVELRGDIDRAIMSRPVLPVDRFAALYVVHGVREVAPNDGLEYAYRARRDNRAFNKSVVAALLQAGADESIKQELAARCGPLHESADVVRSFRDNGYPTAESGLCYLLERVKKPGWLDSGEYQPSCSRMSLHDSIALACRCVTEPTIELAERARTIRTVCSGVIAYVEWEQLFDELEKLPCNL